MGGASGKFALRVRRPLRECGDGTAARRVVAPYGVYISAEVSWWAIRESPLLFKREGKSGGQEGRDCFMAR